MDLEQRLIEKIRLQGKSKNTAETYWTHCKSYLDFCRQNTIGRETRAEVAVERWLTWLGCKRNVAKNTQNVALQAVCYLYKHVLERPLFGVDAIRAKRPQMVRDVISVDDVSRLFAELSGPNLLAAQLMYASGLRVGLVSELRVKDLLFDRCQILVHSAKGDKGRYVSFPELIHESVRKQLDSVRILHEWDADGNNPNGVSLPNAFRRKSPKASNQFRWQYVFPSDSLSFSDDGVLCRHHRLPDGFTDAIRDAGERAKIDRRVTSHILRHSYATHAHELGVSMRTLQVLLGHADIRTTEIYVHADKNGATASQSPLESLPTSVTHPDAREIVSKRLATQLENPRLKNAHEVPKNWRVIG